VAAESGWTLDVHPLPPLLHNHPDRIAAAVEDLVTRLRPAYDVVVVGYADCGTYGALDEVCQRLSVARLPGLHCYDLYAGPGTYLFTDFLVKSFDRTVIRELGLDRYPELREAYFGNYRSVVWLTQNEDPELRKAADAAAEALGLPLTVRHTGLAGLTAALRDLVQA
jgi:hypothetical protein